MDNIAKLIEIAKRLTDGDTGNGDLTHASALRLAGELLIVASDIRTYTDDSE